MNIDVHVGLEAEWNRRCSHAPFGLDHELRGPFVLGTRFADAYGSATGCWIW